MHKLTRIMRKLTLILFLVPSLLFAQTSLEMNVLKALNEYRKSKSLTILPYDSIASAASRHHSNWACKANKGGHIENVDVTNFLELPLMEDRSKYFKVNMFGEIVTGVSTEKFVGFFSEEEIAKQAIKNFAGSPGHDAAMRMEIREGDLVKVAIGVARCNGGIAYVTINFTEP